MLAAFHHALVALRRASSVVVCAHVRPDGDAIGSVLGMTLALREIGIPAVPTLADVEDAADDLRVPAGLRALRARRAARGARRVRRDRHARSSARLGAAREPLARGRRDASSSSTTTPTAASTAPSTCSTRRRRPPASSSGSSPRPSATPERRRRRVLLRGPGDRHRPILLRQHDSRDALRDAADMVDAGVEPRATSRIRSTRAASSASLAIESRALSRLTLRQRRPRRLRVGRPTPTSPRLDVLPEEAENLPDAIRVIGGIDVGGAAAAARRRGPREPAREDRRRRGRGRRALRRRRPHAPRRASRSRATSTALLAAAPAAPARRRAGVSATRGADRPVRHPARRQARRA